MALNRITLQGRITKDIELRYTNSGKAVTSFTIAVDRDRKDASGNRGVDFVDCTIWDKGAEFAAQYFSKGSQAVVDGRLQFREWKDKDGNNRRNAEVLVENIYFCGSKAENTSAAPTGYGAQVSEQAGFQEIKDDGDLPF
jgi:single-strand DNA-binding protein